MNLAIDLITGDKVAPNPGQRALCPYCYEPMCGKCGAVLEWHWAHIGPPCVEWAIAFVGPTGGASIPNNEEERGTCARCRWMAVGKCRTRDARAHRWFAAYADKTGRPQCPAFAAGPPVFVEPPVVSDGLSTDQQQSMFSKRR